MTYTIWQDERESGPYTCGALREIWAAGEIGAGTMFRPNGAQDWVAAADMEEELCAVAAPPAMPSWPEHVKVSGVRVPFGDVLVLVFKIFVALLIVSLVVGIALGIAVPNLVGIRAAAAQEAAARAAGR